MVANSVCILLRYLFRSLIVVLLSTVGTNAGELALLRIGLTPVFLADQPRILNAWQGYLEQHLSRRVEFVQRASYREITDLLLRGELDVAWMCGLPYVEFKAKLSLVAAPVYHGAPLYRSYLIVPEFDKTTSSWENLPKGVFAFSDPDSNSGSLYPRAAMRRAGLDPDRYFRRVFFAKGHRNVVEAVSAGLADAGAVDGYVWDTLERDRPDLTAATRIVARSGTFGFPPIVARADLGDSLIESLRIVLMDMTADPEGVRVLGMFNLDGFAKVKDSLYDSIASTAESLGRLR